MYEDFIVPCVKMKLITGSLSDILMQIFKHKIFNRRANSEDLSDSIWKKAVAEIDQGLFEANLGSGLYKKRIAKVGFGKRGGYRTLLAFKAEDRAFLMYGFPKNERDNIDFKEEEVYKKLAKYYLNLTPSQLNVLIKNGELIEVI